MRFPLGELTKPEVRALAAEAELPVASKADSQDLCFLAGTGKRRVPGPARRRCASGRARSSTAAGACSAATAATTTSRSDSARGSASRRPSRCTCSATDARTNRVTVGPRAELATREVAVRGARAAPAGATRSTP